MRLADYSAQSAPHGYELLNRLMNALADWGVAPIKGEGTRLAAASGARSAVGRFPVVLMFSGHGDDMNANVVLAEYLASHGMFVVSVSLLGRSDEDTFPSGGNDGVELAVRDMEYVLAIVRRYPSVDPGRIAVVGHSIGAVEALVLASRNDRVSAVVGLDGTYGFKGMAQTVTSAVGYSPDLFTGSLLDTRRSEGVGGAELDSTVLESLRFAERWQITLPGMQHNDFTSRAETGALAFQGRTLPDVVQRGKAGYEFVCKLVKDFLVEQFRKSGNAGFDRAAEARSIGAGYKHWVAETPPVTAWQEWAGTISKGQEAIETQLKEKCGSQPLESCADLEALGSAGEEMSARGQLREALMVIEVFARAKPKSVFAQDALAGAYSAVGDWAGYRRALERAIELMPVDPGLRPEVAPSFEQMERDKLERLPK
jgi:pimeloyl-ACP methyl ester carboxylesterase